MRYVFCSKTVSCKECSPELRTYLLVKKQLRRVIVLTVDLRLMVICRYLPYLFTQQRVTLSLAG